MSCLNVAVLISGRINIDTNQYNNFVKIFGKYNPDIFVSHSKGYSIDYIQKFTNLYKPISIIENDEIFNINITNKRSETNVHNTMCMFQNRFNCLQLLQSIDKKYDLVISYRCDCRIADNFIPFENLINKNVPGIHIPYHNDYGGINDQFAFGDMKNMEIYLSVLPNINDLLNNGVVFHPETLLDRFLQSKKVIVYRFLLNYELPKNLE